MNSELINDAAQALSIQGVFLRDSTVKLKTGFVPQFVATELPLLPQYRAGPTGEFNVNATGPDDNTINFKVVVFDFAAGIRLVDQRSLKALEENPDLADEVSYIEITATFSAHYRQQDGVEENRLVDAFGEFGRHNVGYHVWPYWREYVQNTCARLGIPPIPIPMYQLSPKTDEA
jgi:hypothetical protein